MDAPLALHMQHDCNSKHTAYMTVSSALLPRDEGGGRGVGGVGSKGGEVSFKENCAAGLLLCQSGRAGTDCINIPACTPSQKSLTHQVHMATT